MGSTWGNTIKISIFGESHGTGIGVVIDGFPSGVAYDEAFVLREMERRAPGRNKQSTARKEPDRPEIQSGIYNGQNDRHAYLCRHPQHQSALERLRRTGGSAASRSRGLHGYAALRFLQRPARRRPFLRPTDSSAGVRRCAVQVVAQGAGCDGRFAHPVHRPDSGYAV